MAIRSATQRGMKIRKPVHAHLNVARPRKRGPGGRGMENYGNFGPSNCVFRPSTLAVSRVLLARVE